LKRYSETELTMKAITLRCLTGSVLTSALLIGGCASEPPEPVTAENTQTLSATVESIDLDKRLVALRAPDGRTATVEVAPEVRNLSQVQPGDKVVVRYYEALAAQLKKKGESETLDKVDVADAVAVAAPGEKPAGLVGSTVTTTVVIDSVDQSFNTVTFKGPNGTLRTVSIESPEGQKFIDRLRKGDEVEVTYTEALAISVEPSS
jgi:hypothetical protein